MGQAASRQEEFWEACGFGRIHLVKRFIEEGIDVNWKSYTHDCCPIHVASQGKTEVVRLLLAANCDVNVQDNRGNTALHHAAMKGHAEIMQMLIEAGCKVNTEDISGWTALHHAAYFCQPAAVTCLLKSQCDVTVNNKYCRTALLEVARSPERKEDKLGDIAQQLIEAGSDVNARGFDLQTDFTGVMFAAYHGHPEVASALVKAGADINACATLDRWTALHWAAAQNQEEMVYLLLEEGADPTIPNLRGEMPSDRAANQELKDVLLNAMEMFKEMKSLEKSASSVKIADSPEKETKESPTKSTESENQRNVTESKEEESKKDGPAESKKDAQENSSESSEKETKDKPAESSEAETKEETAEISKT